MADGSPLIIRRTNNGDFSTVLARSGLQSKSAVIVTNANGKGLQADATDNGLEASSASGIAVLGTSKATPGVRGVGQPSRRKPRKQPPIGPAKISFVSKVTDKHIYEQGNVRKFVLTGNAT